MRSTLKLISKIPSLKLFRTLGYPKTLPVNYTFLISTVCNSRCRTCNIWKQHHDNLDLKEWKKVFKSLGDNPYWITISGGEPFLQNHLADMVIAVDKICHPAIINVPTNSLLPDRVKTQVTKILKTVKTPRFVLNLSLDGVGKDHDRVRRIPRNFKKVMENYKNMKKLQKRYPNFSVGFGTVVSNFNIAKVKNVIDYIFELEPDQYLTEIAEERVELDTVGTSITPKFRTYSKVADYLVGKMEQNKFSGIGRISRAFRFEYYKFVKDWLLGKKLLPDYAGFASCEITSWGDVWPSCIKGEKMGNVRDTNYDFSKIWFSAASAEVRQSIKKHGTSYPLANAFYTSALMDSKTLLKVSKRIIFP